MHRSFFRNLKYAALLPGLLVSGCTRPDVSLVEVDAGRELARFFAGTYVEAGAVDRIVDAGPDGVTLDLGLLRSLAPDLASDLEALADGGALDRVDIDTLLARSYRQAPGFPRNLDDFERESGWRSSPGAWWSFELTGSMTRFRRRLHIPTDAVRAAVRSFSGGTGLRYPAGSVVVGEHFDAGRLVETTVMRRRADDFWEFAAYDSTGRLTSRIVGEPDALVVPSDCFGCHYGDRAFEPEKSFPAPAPAGVHGPREIVVPEGWRRAEVVRLFDEHGRRDDGLLGLYATLWVSSLVSARQGGTIPESDSFLLQSLGF